MTTTRHPLTSRLDRVVAGTAAAVLVGTLLAAGPVLKASAGEPQQAPTMTPFIVGGEDATRTEYAGFMASLQTSDGEGGWEHFCGASIVNRSQVLTAAHCVTGWPERDEATGLIPDLRIVVGASEVPDGRPGDRVQIKSAVDIRVHPDYDWGSRDGAVVTLADLLDSTVTPVSLPTRGTDSLLAPGALATVIGWGDTSFGGTPSPRLKKVSVPILARDECAIAYPDRFDRDSEFCAGVTGKDSCQKDSGGPIFREVGTGADRRIYQIGIVSWGEGCAATGKPGVYASTASTSLRDGLLLD